MSKRNTVTMMPGRLAVILGKGKLCMIIAGPIKKPMVGYLYQVMTGKDFEWVYPETIEPIKDLK